MAIVAVLVAVPFAQPNSPQDRKPCGHSQVTHRHGKADARKTTDLERLDHFADCARTKGKARWIRSRIDRLKERAAKEPTYGSIDPPGASYLAGLRQCESGGNYATNTGNGFYGAYQFDLSTWQSVGGSGYPHTAPPAEQDYRAAKLWRARGSAPWPVCG